MTAHSLVPAQRAAVSRMALWLRILIPLLLLVFGGAFGLYFMKTRPVAQKRPATAVLPLVRVLSMERSVFVERFRVMGTVIPERTVEIRSPVAGTLVSMGPHFYPGGQFEQGELLVVVDPEDYRIALERAEAALAKARADLDLEKGRAAMARSEVKALETLTGEGLSPTDLTLRKPQMRQMEAAVAAAAADLELAKVQLARTRIAAPFAAVLTRRQGMVGGRVAVGEVLATLAGRERFWIETRVPLDHVPFLREKGHPDGPSAAWIQNGSALEEASVFKILPDLSESSRMVRILVEVEDPLGLSQEKPPLFLGDMLSLDLEGRRLETGFLLPHGALREGNRIWLLDEENRLQILSVDPMARDERGVYVRADVAEGALLVVSDLSLAVEHMAVEREWTDRDSGEPSGQKRKTP